jgi:transglutaminase-like putative cysteine protease
MILEIQHETRLTYSEPVGESVTEVRMEPVSDEDQSCRSFHLAVTPAAEVGRYQDGFRNRVHHFNVLKGHDEVRVLAAGIVETHPRPCNPLDCSGQYPLGAEDLGLDALNFIQFRGPVRPSPRLAPVLDIVRPWAGTPLGEFVLNVSRHINTNFEYARDVTLSSSPVDDVLERRKGVCQDFTHLMIAVLRSFGVPARYVSGYIHRANKQSQSHAWCEAWLTELGWVGIDPTNDCVVNEHFIKVAVGRDFTDVPPNKGIYRGRGQETIHVRVETRALNTLPSLSWQEQLPPLNVPLTAIHPLPRIAGWDDTAPQQQ